MTPTQKLIDTVAHLNPDAGEIGAGMLANLVQMAREIQQQKQYHIVWNGEVIASFKNSMHRNQLLISWLERFAYAADQIIAKDD